MARARDCLGHGAGRLGNDAHDVVRHLKETAIDLEAARAAFDTLESQHTATEESHERSMPGQHTNLAVEGRGYDGRHTPVEQHPLRRDDRGVHDQARNRSAFAIASSMPPHMKNACSGSESNSPLTSRSKEEIVSSSLTYLPGMPVNCSATAKGWDMKR
jgi:hypothetical protein